MFAARPFASLTFAEKASFLAESSCTLQGVAMCAGRGQTIRDGAASTLSVGALLARANPWHNADMWAQAYAQASMDSAVILDVDLLAASQTFTSLQAGYTLPTSFAATAGAQFMGHGIQVVHSVLSAAGIAQMQIAGYAARQASARADGVGSMVATGARKVGGGLDARGVGAFQVHSAITGPGEAIWDAGGTSLAMFPIEAVQSAMWSWSDSSAFNAAGEAFAQAMLQAKSSGFAEMHGHSYANMFSRMQGVGRTSFQVQRASFNMADLLAGGDSWTNLRTATARNGSAYMAGMADAVFRTEYAAAIMASMQAAGAAQTQIDGFRHIFLMADVQADGNSSLHIDAHSYVSAVMDADATAQMDVYGVQVFDATTSMPGIGRIRWNVGNPIFSFLPPAYDSLIRPYEARGVERPYEQRKVERK